MQVPCRIRDKTSNFGTVLDVPGQLAHMHDIASQFNTPYHPFTVIICPTLTPPDNGSVNQLGNTPGGLALYVCNDNFELSGDMLRECRPNGQWTGEAPLCEGEEHVQWLACTCVIIILSMYIPPHS